MDPSSIQSGSGRLDHPGPASITLVAPAAVGTGKRCCAPGSQGAAAGTGAGRNGAGAEDCPQRDGYSQPTRQLLTSRICLRLIVAIE